MAVSMARIVSSTPFGHLVRWLSGNRVFRFPEEMPGFQLSSVYLAAVSSQVSLPAPEMYQGILSRDGQGDPESMPEAFCPEITADGTVVVGWYDSHDRDNPHCWPRWVTFMVYVQINFYTFVIYVSSSIFSAAQPEFMDIYGVPQAVGSLGLALVLLGYGLGALLFSPLSEIPAIGRNPPYIISLAIFILVSGLAVAVDNAPGFLVLRFLQGFFGSPCLATGAASLADVTPLIDIPYGLWIWGTCAVAAPAIAPCIAGFSIMAEGWRWSMWVILWGAAPCLILLVCLFFHRLLLTLTYSIAAISPGDIRSDYTAPARCTPTSCNREQRFQSIVRNRPQQILGRIHRS